MAKKNTNEPLQNINITRATRTIYFFIVGYMLSIIIFDSWNLLTREAIIDRWTIASVLLVANTFVWYITVQKNKNLKKLSIPLLALALLIFAGFSTYWERGMASTMTIFYVLPLLVTAISKNRHALQAVTILAAGTYAFAAVKYFNDFFNEGFRIQLWGTILIVTVSIFTCSWLIMNIAGLRRDSK
jgi:hypothetical protein